MKVGAIATAALTFFSTAASRFWEHERTGAQVIAQRLVWAGRTGRALASALWRWSDLGCAGQTRAGAFGGGRVVRRGREVSAGRQAAAGLTQIGVCLTQGLEPGGHRGVAVEGARRAELPAQ